MKVGLEPDRTGWMSTGEHPPDSTTGTQAANERSFVSRAVSGQSEGVGAVRMLGVRMKVIGAELGTGIQTSAGTGVRREGRVEAATSVIGVVSGVMQTAWGDVEMPAGAGWVTVGLEKNTWTSQDG